MVRRRPIPSLLAVLGCTGVQAYAGPVSGSEDCEVEVVGPERAVWQAARFELDRELKRAELARTCRSVRVEAANGRAKLLFVASDGRRAERDLLAPAELVPSVQALSATAPSLEDGETEQLEHDERDERTTREERSAPEAAPRHYVAALRRAPSRPVEHDEAPSKPGPYDSTAVFGASVGFRTGADDLISPVLGASAAILLDPWELGLVGRFEGKYVDNGGGNDTRPETSGMALGVTAGRREVVERVALRGGAALLFADVREEEKPEEGRAEARVGCYGGAVWPEGSSLALRLDLGAELVPYNIGRSETNAQGKASLPWWAISVAVGPEFR